MPRRLKYGNALTMLARDGKATRIKGGAGLLVIPGFYSSCFMMWIISCEDWKFLLEREKWVVSYLSRVSPHLGLDHVKHKIARACYLYSL